MKRNFHEKCKCMWEWVFPSNIYCISCGAIIDKTRPYALCDGCLAGFHFAVGRTCSKCGKILNSGYLHEECSDCRENEHHFDRGFCCVLYGILEKPVILNYKYGGKGYIGEKIGEMMYDRISGEDLKIDIVVPVPLHKKKLKKRGYNQAELPAKVVAAGLGVPMEKAVERAVYTKPMSKLSRGERLENLKNVFTMRPGFSTMVEKKNILLIDDIYTTGSTADGCAEVLKAAGALKVYILVFAAGGNLEKKEI